MLLKTKKIILDEYDKKSSLYLAYGQKLESLVQEILQDSEVVVHSVSFRRKERYSLEKKLSKQDVNYKELSDITDICGLRVITYFDDEVKIFSKILEKEFQIDSLNSSDKSESLDPDRFGYLSVHYIVSNGEERNNLAEYKRYAGIKAEIQVRSILQHAWAEIEHDLGYKSSQGIPRPVRRRFSRLAGLLELADQEFRTIREELSSYSEEVLDNIENSPSIIELNSISLKALINTSDLINKIDKKIAVAGKCKLEDDLGDDYSQEVKRLTFFGMNTIEDISNSLAKNEVTILKFADVWLNDGQIEDDVGWFTRGVSLFYLGYVLAAQSKDLKKMTQYAESFITTDSKEESEKLVQDLVEKYESLI